MKRKRFFIQTWVWLLVLFTVAPPWIFAQGQGAEKKFMQEELDQILAPIALYPDDLLTQILIASTYPLEVVQADRWVQANKNLKGDQLATALEKQTWDPSVKSLENFPQVLSTMSEKLDWMQKLGDAFLASEKDVMDTVQRLRLKAQEAGNLKSTEQQKVVVQEKVIVIQPAQPEVIYVPMYNPAVVYGPWWWPAYPPPPPFYPYPVYPTLYGAMAFGAGVAMGAAWGYAWGHCNWHGGHVNYNINQNININNNINRNAYARQYQGGRGTWQHDASHRKGVSYRDQATAQKYNRGTSNEIAKSREPYRGRVDQGGKGFQQKTGGASQQAFQQKTAGTGGQTLQPKTGGASQQASQQKTGGTSGQTFQQKAGGAGRQPKDNAFSGIGSGKQTQNYSNRGSTSRSSGSSSGGSGGGGSKGSSGGGSRGGGSSGSGSRDGGSSGGGSSGGGTRGSGTRQ